MSIAARDNNWTWQTTSQLKDCDLADVYAQKACSLDPSSNYCGTTACAYWDKAVNTIFRRDLEAEAPKIIEAALASLAGTDHEEVALRCRGQHGESCRKVAQVFSDDSRRPPSADERAGVLLYERACEYDDLLACTFYADAREDGDIVSQDDDAAQELRRRACDGGVPRGCFALGEDDRGVQALQTLCTSGAEPEACWYVGALFMQGEKNDKGIRVARDEPRGVSLFRRGCDLGHGVACHFLALAMRDGDGTSVDPVAASLANAKACSLGVSKACESGSQEP